MFILQLKCAAEFNLSVPCSITTYGAYALFNLCLSDVIDEDRKNSSRTYVRMT